MKYLFALLLTITILTPCAGQNQDKLSIGRMTGFVVGDAEKGMFIDNTSGPDLILDGSLEVGTEYDIVYRILSRRDRVIIAELIKAEHSARENSKRRALLLREFKIQQAATKK